MHPKIATGRVAIYARYSSDRQSEASIEDQVRRARDAIKRAGGDPDKAEVFADFAISGSTLQRPGFEQMMKAVQEKRVDILVTEDVSRISRDFADAAGIFKRLQFVGVPLIGLSDGIDTSAKHAKLSFTLKSLMSDLYLDDLRDKTLRGLEGRALAGFATGQVPYGYSTIPVHGPNGTLIGNKIVIDKEEAKHIRRIFEWYRDGMALNQISKTLNRDFVPSPRAGSRHKRFGWGASSIRAILYNERYVGVWRFKERQWVKIPGSNKRQPRPRSADEVMTMERPDLRIIEQPIWDECKKRLQAIHRKYTQGTSERVLSPRATHLLSGILVCDECGFPMSIYGHDARYYRCSTAHSKGTCKNLLRPREDLIQRVLFDAIREQIRTPAQVERVQKEMAERIRDQKKNAGNEVKERRERLARTEERLGQLVNYIADGDRSELVVTKLRELEAEAKQDRAALEELTRVGREPLRLPSVEEISERVFNLERRLKGNVKIVKPCLQRWLKNGEVRLQPKPNGKDFRLIGSAFPLALAEDLQKAEQNRQVGEIAKKFCSGGRI